MNVACPHARAGARPPALARLGALLLLAACGYAPVRGKPASGLRVAAVKNDTAQAEAGGIFSTELRRELAGRNRLEPDSSAAPELSAELTVLTSAPSGLGAEGGAASFRISARLYVQAGGFYDTLGGSEDYLVGVDILGTEANRRAALRRLARALAVEAIERYDVSERMR
ncbi:MAG TPA: LPS assembly lipoprotein LptE [Myxococcales bacterium]|nr:LPS assembly lipoprotein LptE [Myxococcales bacterium]